MGIYTRNIQATCVQDLAQDLNAFLLTHGSLSIIDVQVNRDGNAVPGILSVTLVYQDVGSMVFRARLFEGDATQDADAKVTAYFAANPTYRGEWVIDATNEARRTLASDAVVALYSIAGQANASTRGHRPRIAVAQEDILGGATGNALIVSASGPIAGSTFTLTNKAATGWLTGVYGWVVWDYINAQWVGYPQV